MRTPPPRKNIKLSISEFIKRSSAIHGDRYDYSLIIDSRLNHRHDFICKEHGVFQQYGCHHLNGSGCKKCELAARSERAHHGKVSLTCERHGQYVISRYRFKNGSHECDKCREERLRFADKVSYYREVRRLTNQQWRTNRGLIDPRFEDKPRGRFAFHIDHIFTVRQGFELNIDPILVAHYSNLALVPWRENVQRGDKEIRSLHMLHHTRAMAVSIIGY